MEKNINNPNTFTRKKPKKRFLALKLSILCLLVLLILPKFHNPLTVTSYSLYFPKLPSNFDGFKIVLIADLHSYSFGSAQDKLIERILEQAPDVVVLAGDVIDKRDNEMTNVEALLAGITGMFPIYAVPGNHDYNTTERFNKLFALYREYGVIFFDGRTVVIEREDQLIAFSSPELKHFTPGDIYSIDKSPTPVHKNEFNILMHHFGNEFDLISDEYDLMLSGHVHGGLIRLFGKGLINASIKKSFFPKYSKGVYRKESGSVMVLSAGLGNAILPRFNNPREIVAITLTISESTSSP